MTLIFSDQSSREGESLTVLLPKPWLLLLDALAKVHSCRWLPLNREWVGAPGLRLKGMENNSDIAIAVFQLRLLLDQLRAFRKHLSIVEIEIKTAFAATAPTPSRPDAIIPSLE